MNNIELAPIVGPDAETIARAEAARAAAWQLIVTLTTAPIHPKGDRRVWLGSQDPTLLRLRERAATLNSAAFWLRVKVDDEQDVKWGVVEACRTGWPRGARLPADFYSEEKVAARAAHAARAGAAAKFLELPALTGTAKQVPWAETIRARFSDYCTMCGCSEAFLAVARGKAAKSARFWIDNRSEQDFKWLLEDVVGNDATT